MSRLRVAGQTGLLRDCRPSLGTSLLSQCPPPGRPPPAVLCAAIPGALLSRPRPCRSPSLTGPAGTPTPACPLTAWLVRLCDVCPGWSVRGRVHVRVGSHTHVPTHAHSHVPMRAHTCTSTRACTQVTVQSATRLSTRDSVPSGISRASEVKRRQPEDRDTEPPGATPGAAGDPGALL